MTNPVRSPLSNAPSTPALSLAAGVFTFPAAKQAVYAGTTLLTVGDRDDAARAVQESSYALQLYEAATPANRSTGDILAARLDLGRAYLLHDDIDGLTDQLDVVLAVPQVRRTASIVKRAASIGETINQSRYADSPQVKQIRAEIASFCAPPPALPPAPTMGLAGCGRDRWVGAGRGAGVRGPGCWCGRAAMRR